MDKSGNPRHFLLSIVQPSAIILLTAMFFSGAGLARYLGGVVDWGRSLMICFALFFLVWSRNLLAAYFDHPESGSSTLLFDHPRYQQLAAQKRDTLRTYALFTLTAGAGLTLFALMNSKAALPLALLIGLAVIAFFFSAVPPLHLQHRGYGEVIESIVIVNIISASGLLLNLGEINGVIAMLTLPVTLLYLAALLVFFLPNYWIDKKGGNPNLLNKLDWERSMKLHNLLVGSAFLIVAIFAFTGLNWSLAWPLFLPLPLGVFQTVQMIGIMNGGKPRWQLLKWTAAGSVGFSAYLVLLSLWTH